MKKFSMPLRKMAKLLLFATPKKLRKILTPLKPVSIKKANSIYPLKFKAVSLQKSKPASGKRPVSKLPVQRAATATSINRNPIEKQPVSRSWPYDSVTSPAVPIQKGEFLSKSYTNQAGTRSYKLYIPVDETSELRPLIIMLHGCTQNPDDFSIGTGMNVIAEEQTFFVAYPAQSLSANRQRCWNWFKKINQTVGNGEPSIIAGITQDVIQNYPVDASRVYIAGLSAGGAMASTLAHLYPDLYAAVGVHSGLPYASATNLPSALSAMRAGIYAPNLDNKNDQSSIARPIIVFHGDQDTTVSPTNGDRLIEQFVSKNNARLAVAETIVRSSRNRKMPHGRSYSTSSYLDSEGRQLAEYWKIHGGGHAWAGGKISGSFTDPLGPDASREMVRFFLSQKLISSKAK